MGMTEKTSLLNAITLRLVEDYNLDIKEIKVKISDILKGFHITISDERFAGERFDTEYLMKKFCDGKKSIGMSDTTLKQYRIAVALLEKYTGKILSDIDSEDVTNFFLEYGKTVSSVTLRSKYQLLSSIYKYLTDRRYIPHNPMVAVSSPKATVIYKTPLSDLELEKVKKTCEKQTGKESLRNMALIHFFVSTGCRVSEIKNLKIADVDFDKKTCVVMGKGRKEREVVLTEKALFRLQLYLESRKDKSSESPLFAHIRGKEKAMTKDGIGHAVRKLKDSAGITNLTCHTFRRYYATNLRKRDVPIQMIAKSLGHANLEQINRYSLFTQSELQNTLRESM